MVSVRRQDDKTLFPRSGAISSERFQHVDRRRIFSQRRTDLGALHHVADGDQHFAGDGNAFCVGRFWSLGAAMRSRIASGTETRNSFFMNSALRTLTSGQMPATTGMRVLDALEESFEQTQIEHGLGDGVFGSGLDFVGEAANFFVKIGEAGIRADTDDESPFLVR